MNYFSIGMGLRPQYSEYFIEILYKNSTTAILFVDMYN